jgi:uncharacterized protein (DUF3084 family)
MQPEPQAVTPVTEVKKAPGKFNFLAVFLVILLLALAGVGYWAITLNASLKATQDSLTTLQGKYDSLTTEKEQLSTDLGLANTELETTKAELEKAKGELTSAKSDLTKSNGEVTAMQAKIDKASKYVAIMKAMFADQDALGALTKMKDVKDPKLESLFLEYAKTTSPADLMKWLAYIFTTLSDLLK